jgi:hypothetical protein
VRQLPECPRAHARIVSISVVPARVSAALRLFGSVPPPAGPVIERYGSARPWPADRF